MSYAVDPILSALARCEGELSDPTREALVEDLTRFLLGGGVVSWDLWCRLEAPSRAALAEAGERAEVRRARARVELEAEVEEDDALQRALLDGLREGDGR